MASTVFANNREISCKAADGKTICAMPDVCFTPPENPATPPGVPIPYPNTGMASDTTDGSKNVKIGGKEVGLKDKSCFKKSMGDEAGCAAKKGVITSTNTGKVYFKSWSMDVKIEGENAVRHLDLTTNNHASDVGDTPPWPYIDDQAIASGEGCARERKQENAKCKDLQVPQKGNKKKINRKATEDAMCADTPEAKACQKARRCMLVPFMPDKAGGEIGCCIGQTPHHVIPKSSFIDDDGNPLVGWKKYDIDKAPCVCTEGHSYYDLTHGQVHTRYGVVSMAKKDKDGMWNRKDAAKAGAKAVRKTFPESECSQKCIEAQINRGHDGARTAEPDKPIRGTHPMEADDAARDAARAEMGVPTRSIDNG